MANAFLTLAHISNMALVEAFHRGSPTNCVETVEYCHPETFDVYFEFTFGASKYLNNRNILRTACAWSRSFDEDMPADGLLYSIRIMEDLRPMAASLVRKLIGDDISAVLFNLAALRMAG